MLTNSLMLDRLAQLRSGREGLCKRAAPTLEIIVTSLRGIQRSKRRRVLNEVSIRDLIDENDILVLDS